MKIQRVVLPLCGTNCYIVMNEETHEAVIIDPGSAKERILETINKLEAKPVAILLTHGHFDHAGEAEAFSSDFGIQIYASEKEQETLDNPSMNLSEGFFATRRNYYADQYLTDGQEVDLAGFHIRCIHTPGHTPGGCCFFFPYESVLFTGDTLFNGSVGRTDFPGGSMSELVRSIKEKLLVLQGDIICYPGHDSATTLEEERVYNPFL